MFWSILVAMPMQSPPPAQLRVNALFTNGAVLQHSGQPAIWGSARPGAQITLRGSWGTAARAIADANGQWKARLKTQGPGGPHRLTISAPGQTITLSDVLLGDVWLCSGQSNMEWPLVIWPGGTQVIGGVEASASANDPQLRLFQVSRGHSNFPRSDLDGNWAPATPESTRGFSAVGYWFGQGLRKKLNVPVGIIHSSYGGTPIEHWISESKLFSLPGIGSRADRIARATNERRAHETRLTQADPDGPRFMSPTSDDAAWIAYTPGDYFPGDLGTRKGATWVRATLDLPAGVQNQSGRVQLGRISDGDWTYVNGRPVGQNFRLEFMRDYQIPAGTLRAGRNVVAIRVLNRWFKGGLMSPPANLRLIVGGRSYPLNNIRIAPGGSQIPETGQPGNAPALLYNGMIHPIAPYGIRGVLWYQGESNAGRGFEYRSLMRALIEDWRTRFGQPNLPFFFAQIAPFSGYGGSSPDLRESQKWVAQNVPATGMVVTTDLASDLNDIHPNQKREVADRFLNWALAVAYRKRDIVPSGPLYVAGGRDGNRFRLRFDYVQGGLVAGPAGLTGFEIAGEDQKWVPAQAEIDGERLYVFSPEVKIPKAVRYGWSDTPPASLFNRAGLPASPFRTDDWPRASENNRW